LSTVHGQNNTFGLNVGFGGGMILDRASEGGGSFDLQNGFTIGVAYSRKLSESLHFQTGINWYKNNVVVTPSFYPDIDMSSRKYDVTLIYLPVFLKVGLSQYFFING